MLGMGGRGAGRSRLFRAPLFLAPLMRLRRLPQPGFRRRQCARVTVPARPPARRGRRAPAGTAARAAAGRGGGGRGRGRNRGAEGFPGAGGAAAAAREGGRARGGPARRPRPPGMGAPAAVGVPARKAGVERRAELPRPGEGPWAGARWSRGDPGRSGGELGPRGESCVGARQRGGRHWIPSGTCRLRRSPQRGGQLSLPGPPRVGFGPRGALEVARPEKFLPLPSGCRERVPGVRELGCQDAAGRDRDCQGEGPGLPDATSSWDRVEKPRPERVSWSRKRTWDWKRSRGGIYSEVLIWIWG